MANLHEIIDSLNDDNVFEIKESLKKEADSLHGSNKQLYARAKKAEGFELKGDKWVKKEKPKEEPKPKPGEKPNAKQSDGTDYGKLAFLNSKGVDNPDDQKVVMDEAKRLDLPIEKVLGEKHIQSQLKNAKDQREAESGMPEGGSGKSGGNKDSVEYWQNKKDKDGNFITPTDTKLANKVIDARVKAEEEGNMFSDELYN